MRSLMGSFLTISLLVYLGFGAFLYANQRAMIYLPMPENRSTDVLHERITVNGVSIKIWVVNPGRERGALYFGGNAEDVYFNADEFRHFLPDVTTYLVNYRGYGGSEGKPTERVLFADALALFDYLAPRHTGLDAIGRSLGSGVATYLASQRPVGRLALVTPFDDIAAVAGRMYPVYPTQLLLKDRYHSAAYAPHVVAAVQLVIAEHDTLIPAEHAHRLADAFAHDDVVKVTIPGAGHNGISRSGAYWDALAGFFLGEAAFAADRVVD
jgi:pimeloyl-ACP methyl ester carboxylesterase